MFSGIKSILFGYSESTTSNDDIKISDGCSKIETVEKSSTTANDASTLLEQTLNAATTKFTEQLLPQSPSIEQLQSSSRHLLPTLIEQQHEEDEKRKQKEVIVSSSTNESNIEDDDCFNADSWELLDLVDKSSNSSDELCCENKVQIEIINKTGGILKQKQSFKSENKTSRQEPKVSFKTPDLVNPKEEKIELNLPKNDKKKSNETKGKSKQFKKSTEKVENIQSLPSSSTTIKNEKIIDSKISQDLVVVSNKNKNNSPVLDYRAAALSSKNNNNIINQVKLNQSIFLDDNNIKSRGAVKRNRPVSTSSWSSSDDVEAVNDISYDKDAFHLMNESNNENLDDNESILSSGFSDCDYGYESRNDFVMRPKKSSNNKRRGQSSNSNLILDSMNKRRQQIPLSKKLNEQQNPSSTSSQEASRQSKLSNIVQTGQTDDVVKISKSSKNNRSKKKKLVLPPPIVHHNFLKKHTSIGGKNKSSSVMENSANILSPFAPVASTSFSNKPASKSLLQAKSLSKSPSTSGNDSSDIAEMDESWYVTPPPCFTGSNKHTKPKVKEAKEAARENALIEHPSIYISSTSSSSIQPAFCDKVSTTNKDKSILLKKVKQQSTSKDEYKVQHRQIVPASTDSNNEGWITTNNKVSKKQNTICSKSISDNSTSKQKEISLQIPTKKVEKKAWENKFIVTNWNYDEQDDINDDFDNLFGVDENVKPKKQAKTKSKISSLSKPPSIQKEINDNEGHINSGSISQLPIVIDAIIGDNSIRNVENSKQISFDEVLESSKFEDSSLLIKDDTVLINRKQPTLVKPIKPERQPGWQLRKKRSKRRPLTLSTMANTSSPPSIKNFESTNKSAVSKSTSFETSSSYDSNGSSARSSPSLIDRIGDTIVANLTNLTTGFHGCNTMPNIQQQRTALEEAEKFNQSILRKSNVDANLIARKTMSKSYLRRQNDCVKTFSRRVDRRLKMFTTPNGVSINRKVQTNFH